MFSRFIRWSFTVILIQTGILEVTEGWAEREKIADKDSIVALTPIVIQNLEQPV